MGGHDSYVGGAGTTTWWSTRSPASTSRWARGSWSSTTSVPGTGSVDFGKDGGFLDAFGEYQLLVDLAHRTATVDGLLTVSASALRNATATGYRCGCWATPLQHPAGSGLQRVSSGGGGRDRVSDGQQLRHRPAAVRRLQVGPPGRAAATTCSGGRRRRADRRPGARRGPRRGGVDTCRAEVGDLRAVIPSPGPTGLAVRGSRGSPGCSSLTAHAIHSTQSVKTSEASSPSVTPEASRPVGQGLEVGEHDQAAGRDAEHPGRQVAHQDRGERRGDDAAEHAARAT